MVARSPSQATLPNSNPAAQVGYPTGIARRFGALLYDLLLVIAIWMGTLFVWVSVSGGEAVQGVLVQLVLVAEWLAFYRFFWRRQGQTLGMAAWRIFVVDEAGLPPAFKQCLIRALAAPVSMACFGLGYLWFYVGDKQQTWHDRLSHTMVVHFPKT